MTGAQKLTDEELYSRIRNGDRDALAVLYEKRRPGIYRYALHMTGNREVAEEIAQDVFVRLIAPNCGYDERQGPLEPYLYGIARNTMRKLRPTVGLDEAPERVAEGDVLGSLMDGQATAALYRAIRELPAAYREVVALCDLEERSYEEAARLAGCPVGTVRSRLHRARALLAGKLRSPRLVEER